MSIAQYGKQFPVLLRMQNPRGHVELLETIGKGNYGYVYKGKLQKQQELVAVKVVFLKEDEIKETLLEMEILQSCSHENITAYYGCFLKGLDLWICMEYCGAGSIDSVYRAFKNSLAEDIISAILYESLKALEYLHTSVGLIHRDIKAGNLLLSLEGKIKLADFGVSAKLRQVGGSANTFIGTPYWMAPEVIVCDPDNPKGHGAVYDHKSDIWSIGITAIEIAEKNPPLSDIHPMQALQMIAKNETKFAKPKLFSKQFVDFVDQCLIKNPSKRPTASEILQHPFMVQSNHLGRQNVLKKLVDTFLKIKDIKASGKEVKDEDEYIGVTIKNEVPVVDTIKQAKGLLASIQQQVDTFGRKSKTSNASSTSLDHLPVAPSLTEFPSLVNNVQEGIAPVFEPVMLTTMADLYSAAFLDGQYILLGTDHGLFYLDIKKPQLKTPVPIITGIRFRQIEVVPKYNVLIALSGKHDHIRQYRLSALRKLILFIEGNNAILIHKTDTTVPLQEISFGNEEDRDYLKDSRVLDEATLVERWSSDYIKIVNTKDTRSFFMEETESTAYLVILAANITVFRWATEPYDKFMKIKSFWVPETPKFVSLAHDGLAATELFVGYAGELNRVTISDSKVTELRLHREMKVKMFGKQRWQQFVQIPFTDTKLQKLLKESANFNQTTNRKLAAISGPTMKRGPQQETYFLGTYHRLTKVVDFNSNPMVGAGVGGWKDGVMWSEPPVDQILRPLQHVISVGEQNIEIVDWKSAALRQRMTIPSCSFRVLNKKHSQTLLVVENKKRAVVLYWMRESSESPREPGLILSQILNQQIPKNMLDVEDAMDNLKVADIDNENSSIYSNLESTHETDILNGYIDDIPVDISQYEEAAASKTLQYDYDPSRGPPPRLYMSEYGPVPAGPAPLRPDPNYPMHVDPRYAPQPTYFLRPAFPQYDSISSIPVQSNRPPFRPGPGPPNPQRMAPAGYYQQPPRPQYQADILRPVFRPPPDPRYQNSLPRPQYFGLNGNGRQSPMPRPPDPRYMDGRQSPMHRPPNPYMDGSQRPADPRYMEGRQLPMQRPAGPGRRSPSPPLNGDPRYDPRYRP